MARSKTNMHQSLPLRVSHFAILVIAQMLFALHGASASAASLVLTDYRVLATDDKFKDTRQVAIGFEVRPLREWRARKFELAIGAIATPDESRPFVSFGPIWRLPIANNRYFVDFGFSPTVVGGSSLNGRSLGGNFHFTSSVAMGTRFGAVDQFALSLRIQHTSNGGLNDTNPGLDLIGINFTYDLDH